jgi:hypothetical protein
VVDLEEDTVEMVEEDTEEDHLQVVLDTEVALALVDQVVDTEEDHLQEDLALEDTMVVVVKVDQVADMLHVEMTMEDLDTEEDLLQEDQDIVVVRVVVMGVTRSVVENHLEVDMLHVEMRVVLVLHVMVMHLTMLTHNEVNNTCIYTCIYYNLGTQIEFPFFYDKKTPHQANKTSIPYCKTAILVPENYITSLFGSLCARGCPDIIRYTRYTYSYSTLSRIFFDWNRYVFWDLQNASSHISSDILAPSPYPLWKNIYVVEE